MLKFTRLPMGLLALTIAAPVMAQPATTTTPTTNSPSSTMAPAVPATSKASTSDTRSSAAAPKMDMVDINSATAAELKALPGVSDSDADEDHPGPAVRRQEPTGLEEGRLRADLREDQGPRRNAPIEIVSQGACNGLAGPASPGPADSSNKFDCPKTTGASIRQPLAPTGVRRRNPGAADISRTVLPIIGVLLPTGPTSVPAPWSRLWEPNNFCPGNCDPNGVASSCPPRSLALSHATTRCPVPTLKPPVSITRATSLLLPRVTTTSSILPRSMPSVPIAFLPRRSDLIS